MERDETEVVYIIPIALLKFLQGSDPLKKSFIKEIICKKLIKKSDVKIGQKIDRIRNSKNNDKKMWSEKAFPKTRKNH